MNDIFIPGTIWAVAVSEGRIQHLRIGWHAYEPISRLSPPQFTRSDPMMFRFTTERLLAQPVVFTVIPDEVVGSDHTDYERLAKIGDPPTGNPSEVGIHGEWSVMISSDQIVRVVSPQVGDRGGGAIVELESIGLVSSFEEELKALGNMKKMEAPIPPEPETAEWLSILKNKLGPIPTSQRAQ